MEIGKKGTSGAQRIFNHPPHRGRFRLHKPSDCHLPPNAPWSKSDRIKPNQTLKNIFLFYAAQLAALAPVKSFRILLDSCSFVVQAPAKNKNYQTNPFHLSRCALQINSLRRIQIFSAPKTNPFNPFEAIQKSDRVSHSAFPVPRSVFKLPFSLA